MKYTNLTLLLLFVLSNSFILSGQEKKIVQIEEQIDINVNDGDKMLADTVKKQAYKIVVKDENGQDEVLEWDGEGEMPAKMKAIMDEHKDLIKREDVEIEQELDKSNKKQKVRVKTIKDGKEEIIEWDGEGEMPEKIQKLMEEQGLTEELKKLKKEEETVDVRVDKRGDTNIIEVVTQGNGKEEVMKFEYEGDEIPDEIKDKLKEKNIVLNIEDQEGTDIQLDTQAKPGQLGVRLANAPNGAGVEQVFPGTAAEEYGLMDGDVILSIDGVPMSGMRAVIDHVKGKFEGDVLSIELSRSNEIISKDVTLKAKKETMSPFKFKTWDEVMKAGKSK